MKLSIIIPVYNTSKYLRRCLDSVLNQTYKNIEVIIIDDGSIDDSKDICYEYAAKDSRIKVWCQENEGVSTARNKGIDQSSGDLIAFVDSDDAVLKDMYECLIKNLEDNESDISVCDLYRVCDNKVTSYGMNDGKIFVIDDPIKDFLLNQNLKYAIANKVFKRNLIGKTRFNTSLTNSEDRLFIYEIYKKKPKVVKINLPKYIYYLNSDSASTSEFNRKHLSILKSVDIIYNDALDNYDEANNYLFENLIMFERKLSISTNKNDYLDYYNNTRNKLIDLSKKIKLNKKRKLEVFILKNFKKLYPSFVKKIENRKQNIDISKIKDDLFLK